MKEEKLKVFRDKIHKYITTNMPEIATMCDIKIFVELISYIFGDLYMRTELMPYEIDVDKCSDENLKSLSSLIGYNFLDSLTPAEQRESIKMYLLIRKNRGTNFGLKNLIRTFGQDTKTLYSIANFAGVEILEYDPNNLAPGRPQFPGDIVIRIPEMSKILRDEIDNTRLIGTRIQFMYYIFLGVYNLKYNIGTFNIIHKWIAPLKQGYDEIIAFYGNRNLLTTLEEVWTWQISHKDVATMEYNASISAGYSFVLPYEKGFMLNIQGKDRFKGFVYRDGIIKREDTRLYR